MFCRSRERIRPDSSCEGLGVTPSNCIPTQKFVPMSGELNHNRSPLVLDSKGVCCHHSSCHSWKLQDHLLFSDDLVLLASSEQGLQLALDRFSAACEQAGINISTKQTEVGIMSLHKLKAVYVARERQYTATGF